MKEFFCAKCMQHMSLNHLAGKNGYASFCTGCKVVMDKHKASSDKKELAPIKVIKKVANARDCINKERRDRIMFMREMTQINDEAFVL